MYCANCGAQLGDGAAFCPMCGTPTTPRRPEPERMYVNYGPAPAPDPAPAPEPAAPSPWRLAWARIKRLLVILAVVCVAGLVGSIVGDFFATFVGDAVYGDDASSQSSYTANAGYATADEAADAFGDALEIFFNATTTDELLDYGDAYLSLVPGSYADSLLSDLLSAYDLTEEDEVWEWIVLNHWGADDLDEVLEDIVGSGWSDVTLVLEAGEAMDADELEEFCDETGVEAEAGYHIGGTVSFSYDGETYDVSAEDLVETFCLVEVDGAWYVG